MTQKGDNPISLSSGAGAGLLDRTPGGKLHFWQLSHECVVGWFQDGSSDQQCRIEG